MLGAGLSPRAAGGGLSCDSCANRVVATSSRPIIPATARLRRIEEIINFLPNMHGQWSSHRIYFFRPMRFAAVSHRHSCVSREENSHFKRAFQARLTMKANPRARMNLVVPFTAVQIGYEFRRYDTIYGTSKPCSSFQSVATKDRPVMPRDSSEAR